LFCDAASLTDASILNFHNDWLLPGFIDLQLYGGNGQLFSDQLSVESLQATYAYSVAGGATSILPTVATNSWEVIFKAISTIKEYQRQQLPGILGMHLEGPFINPLKRGAHLEKYIVRPTLDLAKKLVNEAAGVIKIITLAPECCEEKVLEYFIDNHIILSAGHSNATLEQANRAFDKGVHLATHLFNAMSPIGHREPGLAAAVMLHPTVCSSIVPDGYHVNFEMIRMAKQLMAERLFIITDAVTGTGGAYAHQLSGDRYVLPDGTLSGSALTMIKAVKNCIEKAGIPVEEALRMATVYPAKATGMNKKIGHVAASFQADYLRLDQAYNIVAVAKDGIIIN
jgi:N-acetylglucosamine-6-phosphate deacetylase